MKNENFLRGVVKSIRQIKWRRILEVTALIVTIVVGTMALLEQYIL